MLLLLKSPAKPSPAFAAALMAISVIVAEETGIDVLGSDKVAFSAIVGDAIDKVKEGMARARGMRRAN